MDLEILEALALSNDRATALGQLLPGSEDHDYFRALHLQHAGALDAADTVIDAWVERHGHTPRYDRLVLRQRLYRLSHDPASVADEIRDHFGVSHWHEAEVAELDPSRPSRLPANAFDPATLLAQAVDYGTDLAQVTDEGLYELLARPLDQTRRRVLLSRISHTPQPELVALVADDLAARGSDFGASRIHNELTFDQLQALAGRRPELRTHRAWIDAVIRRMRPLSTVDLELDRTAREAYLVELWRFVSTLPSASNSLKAHVLWHLLDAQRRRDAAPDPTLIAAYLQLPRNTSYTRAPHNIAADTIVQLGSDFSAVTGLARAGDDEELVRDLLHRRISDAERFAAHLDRAWLDAEIAAAQLLTGTGDIDRATLQLGPARAAALRERIDLAWCVHNPTTFGVDEIVALEADVKHVPELVVNVFRVDPLAYFQHHHREVGTDLDLDGLAASHELVMRFSEPPIRRIRRRIELPMCARGGTYVVDLIGNGMSSRVVIHKGRLRHVSRVGAAGHVITILDDGGRPVPAARAWIGDREYAPDERGTIVVPFSTAPGRTPMLLSHGDLATVAHLELVRESYELATQLVLDRQSLASGRTARALARVRLTCAGAPASLALLEKTTWDVTLTDRHGISTTKSQPLVLADDDACVLEWPLGEDPASIRLAIRGTVKVVSEQRDLELSRESSFEVATMHGTPAVEALYLARTDVGYVISALGKSGEPRGRRSITIGLVHRWSRIQQNFELATDDRGRVELGALAGLERITATLGSSTLTWTVDDPAVSPSVIHARRDRDVTIAIPTTRTAADVIRRLSLVELRAGAPLRHATATLTPHEGAIAIANLAPGEYRLRGPGLITVTIRIADATAEVAGHAVTRNEIVELSRRPPAITQLAVADTITIRIADVTARTRVHVLATRFAPAFVEDWNQPPQAFRPRAVSYRADRVRGATYVSGRELGDEYRYVLERRNAKRFPGVLLDKPSLLLHPWARRVTTTDVAVPKVGGAFAAAPARSAAGYAQAMRGGAAGGSSEAYLAYDFVPEPPMVIANLVPATDGTITISRAELGRATTIAIIVDDPAGTTLRYAALAESPLEPRDLRLRVALDPARHAIQQKAIRPLRPGETLVIEDLATAKLHVIDSIERAHAYLIALRDDATLREFAFITRWHAIADTERRELYSRYACHELHLFLYVKDLPFFDAVVRPSLAYKHTKTFLDHWLLEMPLASYLEPGALARLNAIERALLARRMTTEPAIARILGDEVAILPPDPTLDARLVDALIGASTLDGDTAIGELQEQAFGAASEAADEAEAAMPMMAPPAPASRARSEPSAKKKMSKADDAGGDDDGMVFDLERRPAEAPMFRVADRTQEWAENNWWHRTPADSDASMISPNRLWRDLARHTAGPFLSPALGLATESFAEAMCALAVTDLPFVPVNHALAPDGARLALTAASNALAGSSQLVDGLLVAGGAPLVVGQSYVRADDRYHYVDGEQIDKYVQGALAAGVVYTCQVVLANPTSSRQRVAALVQIPRGSIAVSGARTTQTIDVLLAPYGTHGHEYSFYFPTPGRYTHFPVHVERGGAIVAAAPGGELEVTAGGAALDPHSWPHISQRGTLAEVVAFLERENLAPVELERMAWRLRERASFEAIVGVLERRRIYDATAWGYALLHHDPARIRVWARALGDALLAAGPVLDMPIVEALDAEVLGAYEHLELAPLINARAHRLGAKLRILNDGLAAQYERFLDLVAHRRAPTPADLLAAASYLLAQDRNELALSVLARVQLDGVSERMQYDYVAAYAACLAGEPARARELAVRWRDVPVDRWRHKFAALLAMLDELGGGATQIVDPKSRDQQQAELASRQPTFELTVDRDGVVIRHQHVAALELRFFEMDVELLFSRQPFVQSDVSRFSFIEPGHREQLERPGTEHRVAWPAALRGKNVVVEAVGAGQRKAKIHYANDLATHLAHQYGQVRVQRASDRTALVASYVKVYARRRGGAIAFYKDGYTDLRGWFDYASLSTDDLDHVEQFAILVCSDQAGSAILEAGPPVR